MTEQQSCTTGGGKTIQSTSATYTGTSLGDVSLAGTVTVTGLLTGHVGSRDAHSTLLANLSAGFSASAGFAGGKIGVSDDGSAAELAAGDCKSSGDDGEHKGNDNGMDSSSSRD